MIGSAADRKPYAAGGLRGLVDRAATRTGIRVALWIAATTALSTVYEVRYLRRGWVPHDEGTLAQSAERVLQGQLPHRDFDEVYTGGLSYLHALAFTLFGHDLVSLRLVLLAFFVVWVPVFFYVASRFASSRTSSVVTLVAVAWSVPNYSASMPSWYTLFFATFACAALVRYVERPRAGWLFVAGLAAGCSTLVKVTGLYEVAAICAFFVFRNQLQRRRSDGEPAIARAHRALVLVCAAGLVLFVFALVQAHLTEGGIADFIVPVVSIAAFLAWNELRLTRTSGLRLFLRTAAPFAVGMLIPIVVFLVPYIMSGSVGALVGGVFVAPASRIESASYDPPGLLILLVPVPFVLIFLVANRGARRFGPAGAALALVPVVGILVVLGLSGTATLVLLSLRAGARLLLPLSLVLLARRLRDGGASDADAQRAMIVISAACLGFLVQYPFAASVYFLYALPLVFLAALAAWRLREVGWAIHPAVGLGGLVLLGVTAILLLGSGYAYVAARSAHSYEKLRLPRGGIDVPHADRVRYEKVVHLIWRHATGRFVYAGPDAPEVSFLSGYSNPTRAIFDFLAPGGKVDETQLMRTLRAAHVNVAVVNRKPGFSRPLSPSIRRSLTRLYPHHAVVGRFDVRWR